MISMVWYEFIFIGLLFCFGLFVVNQHLSKTLEHLTESFKQPQGEMAIDLGAIKEEMLDMVHDTIQNLQPPNAMDHIMGAVAQFLQVKMMRSLNLEGGVLPEAVEDVISQGLNDTV